MQKFVVDLCCKNIYIASIETNEAERIYYGT